MAAAGYKLMTSHLYLKKPGYLRVTHYVSKGKGKVTTWELTFFAHLRFGTTRSIGLSRYTDLYAVNKMSLTYPVLNLSNRSWSSQFFYQRKAYEMRCKNCSIYHYTLCTLLHYLAKLKSSHLLQIVQHWQNQSLPGLGAGRFHRYRVVLNSCIICKLRRQVLQLLGTLKCAYPICDASQRRKMSWELRR